jgi:hypothetical protein
MIRPLTLTLLLSFPAFTACAGMTYRADVGPMFARTAGDVALQNAGGTLNLGQERNSVDGNLGLGETEPAPYIRVEGNKDKHRFRLHGFGLDAEGSGTLDGDFGGLVGGSQVQTSMEFFAINGNWGYQLLRNDHWRLAVGAQLAFYSLDVAARSALGRETVDTQGLVPMPFGEVETMWGKFTFGANAGVMAVDLGDAKGTWFDAEAYARLQLTPKFDLMGGVRYLLFDVEGRAEDRDFEADMDIQGLFLTAGVSF